MNRIVYFYCQVLFIPLVICVMAGCAPTQYAQLKPISGPVAPINGRMVTKASVDSIDIVASFEREDMEFLALDIELKNHTSSPIEVDPASFQIDLLTVDRQPLTLAGRTNVRQAADPAYESGRTEFKIKNEEKRLKRAKVLNTVLLIAVVASDIASSTSRSTNRDYQSWVANRVTHDLAYNVIQAKRVIDRGVFADRMQRYQFEDYRWRELAMKRSVVQPGESVRGFVYLPKVKEAAFLNLSYPTTSGTSIELLFEQSLTKVKPR